MKPRGTNHKERLGNLRNSEGFTLIEVLVAISILCVGLLALGSMQSSSIRGNGFATRVTEGATIAADRLEKLFALPYTDPELSAGAHTDPAASGGYTVSWEVANDFPIGDTKRITLQVTWIAYGVQKRVSIQRILPRMM